MDRNNIASASMRAYTVALRKESVDRNLVSCIDRAIDIMSLSARRAWIEICLWDLMGGLSCVALRKESVDRNFVLRG